MTRPHGTLHVEHAGTRKSMDVVLWITQGLLAAVYLAAGSMKLTRSREQLLQGNMGWVEDFSDPTVKTIGALELLGAIGLVVPWATDIAPVLTPLAAVGLALDMAAAATVHTRRKDPTVALGVVGTLFVLNTFVAVGRFADL
jgi:uncharacterized membrane protein YphA (DoxX/SURF4 family)